MQKRRHKHTMVNLLLWFLRLSSFNHIMTFSNAYSNHNWMQPRKASRRYFFQEIQLPPLESLVSSSSSITNTLSSYHHGKSISAVYTNSPKQVSNWLSENLSCFDSGESGAIIGFDVESNVRTPWNNDISVFEGPCTVQLATMNSCLVVHLFRKSGRPSMASVPILEAVLSDDSIIKAGVGIDKDLVELCQSWGNLEARSRLNLGGIGVKNGRRETTSLKRLSKAILQVDLRKSRKMASGDWSHVPLLEKQIIYSSRDAWAGAAIVEELQRRDPKTFSASNLKQLLENQPSIQEMATSAFERKQARDELTQLLAPYQPRKVRRRVPTQIHKEVSRLQETIKASRPVPPISFDVQSLGINIERTS
jgi:3'-5' exonuclease